MNKIEIHKNICDSLNDLYKKKNQDYGDSFSKSYKEYGLTMSCIRLEDKLNRLKSLNKNGNAQVKDEVQALDFVEFRSFGGQHNDWNIPRIFLTAESLENAQAIFSWQHDVQNKQLWKIHF